MSAAKLWYYCDSSGQQQGPVADKDLITEYNAGNLKDEHLVWSESLSDWTPFSQVGEVYAQIQQAKAKSPLPSKVSSAAPRFGVGAPAKPNLVEEIAKKSMESLQQQQSKPSANTNAWTKVVGADGYPYYTNNETHETTWDRPDGYHSEEEALAEQKPKAEVRQLSAKTTSKPVSAIPVAPSSSAASSSTSELTDLKAMLVSLKADFEQTSVALKDSIKTNEKTQQDRMQAQEKLIADLKAELTACKSEVKETKTQITDYQKTLGSMQTSVKSASDSISDLKTSTQSQFKQIKTFAKSLADNIKE